MSPVCASTRASDPEMSWVNASYASLSERVPAGSPGKHRLRFLPSSGTRNGVRARNAGRFSTGTATTRPRRSRSSRLRAHWRTPAIDAYSQPCTPASTVRRGPSAAPVSSMTGTSRPASVSVWRRVVVGMRRSSLARPSPAGAVPRTGARPPRPPGAGRRRRRGARPVAGRPAGPRRAREATRPGGR